MMHHAPSSLRLIALISILSGAAFMATPAYGAPQILAVASTDIPVPLYCEKGECTAELTAICLQEHRASPQIGTHYYFHDSAPIQLSATTPSGENVDISSLPYSMKTARGHTSIRVSILQKDVKSLAPTALHVSVPERATAIPVPIKNDRKPQTDTDILIAVQSLRLLAGHLVDNDTDRADAARLVNLTLNRLPIRGRAQASQRVAAKDAFQAIITTAGYSKQATHLAQKALKQCDYETKVGFWSLRQCLGSSHDQLIGKLNTKFWKSLNSGS
ncbi:hypothetical protein [Sneathiella aquimaris]|uniref:hypothetical protein n=1 Tax=Sneathiella aquimaris TaxID=2599305 RepID=UPI00146A45E1|nr:hypothetical protein [Sneathiella aquimaris]